jgi:hypothetical protein
MGIDIESGPLGAISGFVTITHNARALQHVGFLSHLHSLVVTMSQKSSGPQAAKSVSQALMPDTHNARALQHV